MKNWSNRDSKTPNLGIPEPVLRLFRDFLIFEKNPYVIGLLSVCLIVCMSVCPSDVNNFKLKFEHLNLYQMSRLRCRWKGGRISYKMAKSEFHISSTRWRHICFSKTRFLDKNGVSGRKWAPIGEFDISLERYWWVLQMYIKKKFRIKKVARKKTKNMIF